MINEYFTFSAHGTQIGEGANARVNQENKYSSKKKNPNVIKMSKEYGEVGIDDLTNEQVILKKIAQEGNDGIKVPRLKSVIYNKQDSGKSNNNRSWKKIVSNQ